MAAPRLFHPASTWTDERVTTLRTLWAEGLSCSQIARALGGVTRNAVIGKASRLGLAGRETPSAPRRTRPAAAVQPRPAAARQTNGPPIPKAQPMPELRVVETKGEPRILAELGPHQCRWPLDDPGPGNMDQTLFCATGGVEDGQVYCAAHRKLAAPAGAALARHSAKELVRSLRRYA